MDSSHEIDELRAAAEAQLKQPNLAPDRHTQRLTALAKAERAKIRLWITNRVAGLRALKTKGQSSVPSAPTGKPKRSALTIPCAAIVRSSRRTKGSSATILKCPAVWAGVDPLDPTGDKAPLDRLFRQGDARPGSKAAARDAAEIQFDINARADKGDVAGTGERDPGGLGGRATLETGAK